MTSKINVGSGCWNQIKLLKVTNIKMKSLLKEYPKVSNTIIFSHYVWSVKILNYKLFCFDPQIILFSPQTFKLHTFHIVTIY
jgi:hypothetical protein